MAGQEVQEAIRRDVAPLWIEGSVYELRVPKARQGTVSGYFDNLDALALHASRLDGQADGVYMTLNPVHPALLARAANKVRSGKPKTTSDGDVLSRKWLLLDFDPVRPSETSSTEEQHDAALRRSGECARWLLTLGFPRGSLVGADSGNGAHLLVRVELPNDGKTGPASTLVTRCLQAIAIRFSDPAVAADISTGSASHLMKVYGTRACKGEDLPDYPHRSSRLVVIPDTIEPAPQEALERLASYAPAVPETRGGQAQTFDLEGFIRRHLGDVAQEPVPWNGGQLWRLRECVFSPDHGDGNPAIIRLANGAIAYHCFKPSCQDRRWSDVRDLLEPKPARRERTAAQVRQPRPRAPEPEPAKLLVASMTEIQREDVTWLWHPYIPYGKLTLIEGDPGTRKSHLSLAVATAVSLGSGLPGDDREGQGPAGTLLLIDEDGLGDTVKPRLQAMEADLRKIDAVLGLVKEDEMLPLTLTGDGIQVLAEHISESRPRLVIIDPLIAYTSSKVDTNNAGEVRSILRPLIEMAQHYGCAIVALRHLNKAAGGNAAYRGQGSIDYYAAARSVLTVAFDRDDARRSIMAVNKASLVERGPSQVFFMEGSRFTWGGTIETSVDEMLLPIDDPAERSALEDAKRFLTDALFEGGRPAKEIQHEAREAGHSEKTVFRAKTALRVRSTKEHGANGRWLWELPPPSVGHVGNLGNVIDFPADSGEIDKSAKIPNMATQWWDGPDKEPF